MKMHAQIQASLDAQAVEITRQQTLEQQTKTLLEGLNAQIAAGSNPAEIVAAIDGKTATIHATHHGVCHRLVAAGGAVVRGDGHC